MKVLLFHPTLLPPKNYGGVERVVLWLAKGLRDLGHEVFVAALPGSQLPKGCQLIEVESRFYSKEELCSVLPKTMDVAHFMAPLSEKVWEDLPFPALLTVHGNGQPGESYPKNSVFLSQDHAQRHGAQVYVYNGLDPEEFLFEPEKKVKSRSENRTGSFLFLSKTTWRVKNLTGAMHYCKAAEVPLTVAGGNRPVLQRIQCLFRPGWQWAGPVGGTKKAELLSHARALVFPVLWPEPFGLVVAEALISGTPVIASPQGSLKELLPADVGVLPQSAQEWVETLQGDFSRFSPERCRAWAMEKFHFVRMAEAYVKIYQQIAQGKVLHSEKPIAKGWR